MPGKRKPPHGRSSLCLLGLLGFDPEKLPEGWVHPAIACLPLLPRAQGAIDQRGRLGLRQPGNRAGGPCGALQRQLSCPASAFQSFDAGRQLVRQEQVLIRAVDHHRGIQITSQQRR